ncbi:hypothetical protein ACLB2K_062915 [Fragaria x ananassa]
MVTMMINLMVMLTDLEAARHIPWFKCDKRIQFGCQSQIVNQPNALYKETKASNKKEEETERSRERSRSRSRRKQAEQKAEEDRRANNKKVELSF